MSPPPAPPAAPPSVPATAYEAVIGLEVHAQLRTRSKIFCGCDASFGAPPNSHVCAVCLGLPGALPVLNRSVVEMAVRAGLMVGGRIRSRSVFARKNYFYPDLPKGYQISQYDLPLCEGGSVPIEGPGGRDIGLIRIHIEEDAGKLIHGMPGGEGGAGPEASLVDFNRSGVPLIEIVAQPEIRTADEAYRYLVRLRSILTYLDICDGNMEEGSLRCDANISVRPAGSLPFGTRAEVKNLNSFRNVHRALGHEIERQVAVLRAGGRLVQETRLWDEAAGATVSMRSKEEAHDYRYFPEPDLPPLEVDEVWMERLRATLPEHPAARKARFLAALGLPEEDAELLTLERPLADYFEEVARLSGNPRAASNWVRGDLLRLLKETQGDVRHSPIGAADLAAMVRLVDGGTISGKIAKTVFEEMARGGGDPAAIVARLGLVQITDEGAVREAIGRVLAEHAGPVAQYRAGKTATFGFLVGQVMKATAGKANPALANRLLRELLGTPDEPTPA